ncbi:hypothetical protein LPJ66_009523 [Kickxella alabastrina]|uniref:Uncharacterized protein n=1 Tax=Kickxella alabastrina TaxID=61397 RepID=A0ACC1I3M8_9FUNG|nr:hypothetical protein LPJ66_009523 [Kickxella alabastrina]
MGNSVAKHGFGYGDASGVDMESGKLNPRRNWLEHSLADFDLLQVIGQGAFGKVRMIEHRSTKQRYALKYISKAECIDRQGEQNILRERDILELLAGHPHIPTLHYSFQDVHTLYLVMELKAGGDLRQHIQRRRQGFPEATVRLWIAEVACALHYMHSAHQVMHRDVKPDNILMDCDGHVSLGDFNAAVKVADNVGGVTGTTSYMAPELLMRTNYSYPVDWWSLGVVLYECVYGRRPYRRQDHGGCRERLKMAITNEPLVFPSNNSVSVDCIALMRGLLCTDPDRRLGYGRLRKHAFFSGLDWTAVEQRRAKPGLVPDSKHVRLDTTPTEKTMSDVVVINRVSGWDAAAEPRRASRSEAVALEREFHGYSNEEFQAFKQFVQKHGTITSGIMLQAYLAQLSLDGRLIINFKDEEENQKNLHNNYNSTVALGAAGLAYNTTASAASAATSMDTDDSRKSKRRTTTSTAAAAIGRIRYRSSWRITASHDQSAAPTPLPLLPAPVPLDMYTISNSIPPSNVPIDPPTWSLMLPEQRRLAHRFSNKIDIDAEYYLQMEGYAESLSTGLISTLPTPPKLPVAQTLSSPSSSPALKQNVRALVDDQPSSFLMRPRPSMMLLQTQPASLAAPNASSNSSSCSSPTMSSHCPLSPTGYMPRLQPIAAGWVKYSTVKPKRVAWDQQSFSGQVFSGKTGSHGRGHGHGPGGAIDGVNSSRINGGDAESTNFTPTHQRLHSELIL